MNRWAPLSGIAYVLLSLIGLLLVSGSPAAGDSDQEWLSYYADSGNRQQEIVAFFLFVLAALFFIWFAAVLRGRLLTYETEPRTLSALVYGSGVASAVLLMAGVSGGVAHSFTIWDTDEYVLDPNVARLVGDMSFLFFACSMMVAVILIAATSVLAIRTPVLPAWLGWIGLVAALAELFALAFFPLFVLWAWVLLVSIVLTMRQQESPGIAEATP
jgi:hypothetical protein